MTDFAILFDLDGVISDTAATHAKAWKKVFNMLIAKRDLNEPPFSVPSDYLHYLDGKTRLVGIESFLHSRNIELPLGEATDTSLETVRGIGNRKNKLFQDILVEEGVKIFEDALNIITNLRDAGAAIGIASSSKNAKIVLENGQIASYFRSITDGLVAEENNVASKPSPEFYRYAAAHIGFAPSRCIVIEDAISGVVSAKEAGIGAVIGIARNGDLHKLEECGADLVVESMNDISVDQLLRGPEALIKTSLR